MKFLDDHNHTVKTISKYTHSYIIDEQRDRNTECKHWVIWQV